MGPGKGPISDSKSRSSVKSTSPASSSPVSMWVGEGWKLLHVLFLFCFCWGVHLKDSRLVQVPTDKSVPSSQSMTKGT